MNDRLTRRQARAALDFQSPDPQGVDLTTQRRTQHEAAEQRALWQWVQTQPWRHWWAHWPNERQQRREAQQLSAQGVRRGMPDNWLFLRPVPPASRRWCGAASELKRPGATRSAVSEEQRWWLLHLESQGWAVGVHRGWLEASEFFRDYVAGVWEPDGDEWWR